MEKIYEALLSELGAINARLSHIESLFTNKEFVCLTGDFAVKVLKAYAESEMKADKAQSIRFSEPE